MNEQVTVLRTRIATVFITPPNQFPEIDFAMNRWKKRLKGIIEDSEIEVAASALRAARIKALRFDNSPIFEEAYGTRFETRIRAFGRRRVTIDLLWIDPNEPQAKQAFDEFRTSHKPIQGY